MEYPSERIKKVVEEFSRLPGVGKKTALRLALHLLRSPSNDARRLAESIIEMRELTRFCKKCGNLSDEELCGICSDNRRKAKIVCVVADVRDVLAIEKIMTYSGRYHVLGGVINPMEGISPSDLNILSLIERVKNEDIEEIVFALSGTPEGETTAFHLARKLEKFPVKISTIARGAPVGSDLEFVDETTLARSLENRVQYFDPLKKIN